jgi:electron transfer flavoprotein alpha subunit
MELVDGIAVIGDGCNLCGACRDACSFDAIIIEAADEGPADESYSGVWVFVEQQGGNLKQVGYELLAKGRELADGLGVELSAICFGSNLGGIDGLAAHGADRVYLIDDPALATPQEYPYSEELVRLIRRYKPEIVIAGATSFGRAFFPRVAAVLKTGLTADCTGLDIDPETRLLRQTRPTFGGNVMATIICQTRRPQMSTVRPRVFRPGEGDSSRQGQIIRVDFDAAAVTSRTKLISFVEDLTEKIKLEDADIIVSGGRGLGKPENFAIIRDLAASLNAAVGSSRPPVDEGWVPYAHQVGQTGKTVCPKLYIACGISGAVQHLAGMQTADCIVAINDDPDAPIFEVATYGIVGDLFKVVPLLAEKLKQ